MNERIRELAGQIKELEADLTREIQRIRIRTYEIRDRGIRFQEEVRKRHRAQRVHVLVYLRHARLKHVLSAPLIWACLVPALLMDLVVSCYQALCFPLYGIPKVRRSDHVVIDRHHLAYLNIIEKLNCMFCGYFNGVINYVREVAARTEQYWCPIKHARHLNSVHSRYVLFTEFGDGDAYQQKRAGIRRDFGDLAAEKEETPAPPA